MGSVLPGLFRNPFSRLLSDESGKGTIFAAQKLFSTILKLGSTANPKLSRLRRIRQLDLRSLRLAKDCERKNPDSRSELPFPLSGEILWK
jgi:hypothetical protein